MFFREPQRLGKQGHMRLDGTKYGHRQFVALDHHLCTGAHPRQYYSKVAGGFCFRDVDHMVSDGEIIPSFGPVRLGI